jgi:SAM-dependent methyltransferase
MLADTIGGMSSADEPVVFDRAAGSYDATRGFPPGADERVAELIAAAGGLDRASRLLEIGIGTGRVALPLAKRVRRVIGIDLSAAMMRRLLAKRARLPVELARADAARLPFPDASFDAVLGVHVFHLIPRWREVLAEAARVLRPGAPLLHGADERTESWARWRDRFGTEHRVENVGVKYDDFERFPEQQGWRSLGPAQRIEFSRSVVPRQLIERVAGRAWSFTWRMSDAQLAEATETLRAELQERFGDLDRAVEMQGGFWVRAYLPPLIR